MNLNQVINESLINSGHSQLQLAEYCGITQGAISRILSGKRIPTITNLINICDCLELDIKEMIILKSKAEFEKENNIVEDFDKYMERIA